MLGVVDARRFSLQDRLVLRSVWMASPTLRLMDPSALHGDRPAPARLCAYPLLVGRHSRWIKVMSENC